MIQALQNATTYFSLPTEPPSTHIAFYSPDSIRIWP